MIPALAQRTASAIAVFLLGIPTAYGAEDKVKTVLDNAATWFLNIIVAVSVIMVLIGAFLLTTSGGDTNNVEKAKKTILWGAVGVGVALFARAIVVLVQKVVG